MAVTANDESLIEELSEVADTVEARGHGAFLASYSPEDEGLYDADVGR